MWNIVKEVSLYLYKCNMSREHLVGLVERSHGCTTGKVNKVIYP